MALQRAILSLTRTLSLISASLLTFAVLVNFANVIGRYLFKAPIIWAEETISFSIIASVFFAIPILGWERRHMRMDILISLLPSRNRRVLDILLDVTLAILSIAFAFFSVPLLRQMIESGQRSETLALPMLFPHSLIPLGMFLMGVLTLLRMFLDFRTTAQRDET